MANTNWQSIKMLSLLFIVICSPKFSYSQLTEKFSKIDFNQGQNWYGTLHHFIVNDDDQLQLSAEDFGSSYISHQVNIPDECEWQFLIKLAFSPSSNNYSRVYLISDKRDLAAGDSEAIYLQFGEKGSSDAIELFYKNGEETVSICRGTESQISKSFLLKIKVTKRTDGLWEVYTAEDQSLLFKSVAKGEHKTTPSSSYFGFYCKYSSSNKNKFYFDDVYVGTPIIDKTPPEIKALEVVQANQIRLEFTEAIHPERINKADHYLLNKGMGNPLKVIPNEQLLSVILLFKRRLEEDIEYQLSLQNLEDLSENDLLHPSINFTYSIPKENDLVINEILFNPLSTGEEYIEIYNRSDKRLNMKKLFIGRIKKSFPNPPDTLRVRWSDTSIYIDPNEYWVLSKSPEKVIFSKNVSYPEQIIRPQSMFSLINNEGHIFIQSDSGIKIDEVIYRESMHHPALNFTDGVALEKIHYDANGMDSEHWVSASFSSGFGTPTAQNSQFTEGVNQQEKINIYPAIFSPDQDGVNDIMSLSFNLSESNLMATVIIYNSQGQPVKHLLKNTLIGIQSTIYWDGQDDQGNLLPISHYILNIELYNMEGFREVFKKAVAIGKKLK